MSFLTILLTLMVLPVELKNKSIIIELDYSLRRNKLELAYKYFGDNNYGKNYFSNPPERY